MTTQRPQPAGLPGRRRVIAATAIIGTALLGLSMSRRPGTPQFYLLTLAVAATWTVGAHRSRQAPPVQAPPVQAPPVQTPPVQTPPVQTPPVQTPPVQGRPVQGRPPVQAPRIDVTCRTLVVPVLTGAGAFALTCGAAIATRHVPIVGRAVRDVLQFTDAGTAPLLILTTGANAVAEELFFRGALFSAIGETNPVVTSTIAYTATTTATRNPALILAGAALGTLLGLQRRASGGVLAPALTHLTWSLLTLRFLPRLFGRPGAPPARRPGGTTPVAGRRDGTAVRPRAAGTAAGAA